MRIRSVLIAGLLLGSIAELPAQVYFPDTITFAGTSVSQQQLLAYTGLRPGTVSKEQMDAAAKKLTDSGIFLDAKYELDDDALRYTLTPSPAVLPVLYDNFPWWDSKTLNALVAEKVPLFSGELYPGGPMRQQVLSALTELVAEKGVQVMIGTSPVGDAHQTMIATRFHIDQPPVVIASLTVEGASAAWSGAIGPIEQSAAGKEYAKASLDSLTNAIRDVYTRRGYLDVTVDGPSWGTPQIVAGKITVPLMAKIANEGQPYTVSAVHFAGNAETTPDYFAAHVKIHAGDVADADVVDETAAMLKVPWVAGGYEDAHVSATPALDRRQHTVAYTFTVDPGPVYRMGTLTLIGLNKTQERLVRTYWQMPQGAVFQPGLVQAWRNAYMAERGGQLVANEQLEHMTPEYETRLHVDAHTADILIRFKPAKVVPSPFDFHPTWK